MSGTSDPITFTLDQSDFYSGACANGKYASIGFHQDGTSDDFLIIPMVPSDGSSVITFSDVHAADLEKQSDGTAPTLPLSVSSMVAICSVDGIRENGNWQSESIDADPFVWTASETPTSTTETVSVQAIERIYYAMILTGIFGLLLWKK